MIKITYDIICDICKRKCKTESYECTNIPSLVFPRPTQEYTIVFGYSTEMCYDCAAPLQAVRNEVIRNLNKAAEKNGEEL
jgi:hypothetical protein